MSSIAIIGAGMGGLTAALLLAAAGCDVDVFEAAASPGGKLREVAVGAARIDAGPTVLTLAPVFAAIFAEAGARLDDHVTLTPLPALARHAWEDGTTLDLSADVEANVAAIGEFAGPAAGAGYRKFAAQAAKIFALLDDHFMQAPQPGLAGLIARGGPGLAAISPFASLWAELGKYFTDPRLRQLFARYATYCGASPFAAPATLMLIAEAERRGVWRVQGGMHRLAAALTALAQARGATFHFDAPVQEILQSEGRASGVRLASGAVHTADAVLANADLAALTTGRLGVAAQAATAGMMKGAAPSLSALTWAATGTASGPFVPGHHNVFFSADYPREFLALAEGRLPGDPTVYLCAPEPGQYFLLVNAAAGTAPTAQEEQQCLSQVLEKLRRAGLGLTLTGQVKTGPAEFSALFPGSSGALYGRALEGWRDSFARPGAATKLPGLYLAGGSVHPGPGLPMAALSGRVAARSILAALSRQAGMNGGMSMRSAIAGLMRSR
jgi:1-hydroxycarotenoid 3,4-desaturase